jgi:small-conductance mechanosensitive channel
MQACRERPVTSCPVFLARAMFVTLGIGLCLVATARMAQAQSTPEPKRPAPAPSVVEEVVSDAERVARLQRTIDSDEVLLRELKSDVDNPEGQYAMSESEFKYLDGQLAQIKRDQQKLRDDGKQDEAAALHDQIEAIERKWKLSKERFAVALEERKNLVGKIGTLEEKIRKDREEVSRLTGSPDAAAARGDASGTPRETATSAGASQTPGNASSPSASSSPSTAPSAATLPASGGTTIAPGAASAPLSGGVPAVTPSPSAPAAQPVAKLFLEQTPSAELVQARDEAKTKEVAAHNAEEEAATLVSRINDVRKLIDQERKSLELAGKKSDLAIRAERALEQELERKLSEGAHWIDLQSLRARIAEANRQDEEARAEARESAKRLDDIQSEFAALHARQIAAMTDADRRRREAGAAQKRVEQLQNPFAPKNLARWLLEHGPRLGACIGGMAFLLWLARRFERRMIAMAVARSERSLTREREARTRTFVGVAHNAWSTAVIVCGSVLVLNEIGVNVALLMGGAAVFGLAVAFGAQNLIRDYFYGFVILLENQYKLNDVVQIGAIAGQVERITLRMTVLRDLEGGVHFIPNGQISSVCNKTHRWSRALFEIPVAYKEDADQVMELLVRVGTEIRNDAQFAPLILEDPTMLGVDSLGDSAMIIKFFIKTKPLQQWTVKREVLRRVKKSFDAAGIEIPFPHRTVYYRNLSDGANADASKPPSRSAA